MKSRMRLSDLILEAIASLSERPGRCLLTLLGTVLGVGSMVSVVGLTATASSQISDRFTELSATQVSVEQVDAGDGSDTSFPADAVARLRRLNGVREAGTYWIVDASKIGKVAGGGIASNPSEPLAVVAATPGVLKVAHARISYGRLHDDFSEERSTQVALVGRHLAERLGVTQVSYQPAIVLGDHLFTVIGLIDGVDREADQLLSVVVPSSTASRIWGQPKSLPKMIVETDVGAASVVSSQVAVALRPDAPDAFRVIAPPNPRELSGSVNNDLSNLFLALAVVCLLVGATSIANMILVSVMERRQEIGIRRALGARIIHVCAQILVESSVVGLLGGLAGAGLGVITVLVVAIIRQWSPTVVPWSLALAPILGMVVGALAGLYPAVRGAKVQPIQALRG